FITVQQCHDSVSFHRHVTFINYCGTPFDIDINRIVRLISTEEAWRKLNVEAMSDLNVVAFETDNTITKHGQSQWSKKTGLLSIWILGMFNASPQTTVVIPIQPGPESALGKSVNDDYFGKVPSDR